MIEKQARLYLCRPDGSLLTQLNGVRTESVEYSAHVKDYNEISFTVDRYIVVDGELVESNGYDDIHLNMNVLLEGKDVFQLQEPTISNDGIKEYKTIKGYSREKEFEDKDWVGLKVNTGEEDSLEYLIDGNVDEHGFAKDYITIYRGNNSNKTAFSLIHKILGKMPGWSVDDSDIDPLLWTKKIQISEDNTNLYALLTNIIAPKAECLFIFDTINRKIKAIAKEHLDEWTLDTNIFISMRNLANQIDVNVDEDSVFTVFSAYGEGDLDVRGVNFNDGYVYDLSFFKAEPWMKSELVAKINAWEAWRDENRNAFIQLSKDRAAKNAELYEIDYRVPNDADEWTQWDTMDTELLEENLALFQQELETLQISVDEDPTYDSDGNYQPHMNDLEVDHNYYLTRLLENKSGYYTYIEIYQYIIPNIETAISNKGKTEDEKEDYVKDYETNWDLYGIIELEGKEDSYQQQMETLSGYEKSWSELTETEKAQYVNEDTYNIYHNEYAKFQGYLGSSSTSGTLRYKLAQLREERSTIENEIATIDNQITTYAETADIENAQWGLTENELITFKTLCHHTDYENSNILTTSIDTTVTTIDVELELYEDAVSKLSEVSRPQYSFSVDLDNLLNIPEFESWVQDFELLRFMRLGVRDDYSVKLRLVGYTTNPCEIDPQLTLEFSSYITSRSGRSDLTNLLDTGNNRGSKNSYTIGTGNSKDDKEYVTNLLSVLTKNGLFTSAVSSIASGTFTIGSASASAIGSGSAYIDDAHINNLIAQYVEAGNINVDKIQGREAWFQTMGATYIDSEYVVAELIKVKTGSFQDLVADVFNSATGQIFNLTSSNATVDQAFVTNQIASRITVADLQAGDITLTDTMKIVSENGNLLMNGRVLQMFGTDTNGDPYVGIQLGYDTNDNPSLVVRNEQGAVIINPLGITQNAIADGLIINNMIQDATISEDKLNFQVMKSGDSVSIEQIYTGDGQFGAQWTTFTTNTNSAIEQLQQDVEDAGQNFDLYIETPNGTNIYGGNIQLSVKLLKNNIDVTDEYDASCFTWTRTSRDNGADATWNDDHNYGSKVITITASDVKMNADFQCKFEYENVSITAG